MVGESSSDDSQEIVNLSYNERIEKGDSYFEQDFLTLAADEYAQAALMDPSQINPYLKLIDTHFELRNYDKALTNVETVLERDPANLEAQFDQIRIHIKLSDFNTAKSLIDTYPPNSNQAGEILYYKALLTALFNDHALAKTQLNEAKALNDPDLTAKIERILNSYKEFEATQAGQDIYLKILLAKSLNQNEEYEIAIHILKEVLKTRGDSRDGWILLGFAYLNLQNYQFALTAFDKAFSIDSTWSTTLYFLGITHKELGDAQKAITYFTGALKGNFEPKVVIQNHLADLYFETNEYEKAVQAYEAVLAVNKQDINSFVRPVWLYLDYLNDPQKALKLAQVAMTAFPDTGMSYNLVGWSYIGMGDYKNADANLKKALQLDPSLAAAYHNLGQLNEKWGKDDLALENYLKAYELDKNGPIGNLAAEHYNALIKRTFSDN